MRLRTLSLIAVLLVALVLIAMWFGFCRDASDDERPATLLKSKDYVAGVPSPAGLSLGLGGVVITSLGSGQGDGAVYVARSRGDRAKGDDLTKVLDRLPSARAAAPSSGGLPFLPLLGPVSAADEGRTLAIVLGGSREPLGRLLVAPLRPGAAPEVAADIAAFWQDAPEARPSGARASAPFDTVRAADGTLFVSDAGANAILRIGPKRQVSVHASFDLIRPPEGEPFAAVPAGLAFGPDGALYVALFSGEPYGPGRSRIYRLQDRNGDGDAADGGERTIAADGLALCIDLAFGPDGQLYALEYAASLDDGSGRPANGRLWRLRESKAELLADDLLTPMSLVIDERGDAYVSERDTGKVRLFRNAAPPPPSPSPSPSPKKQ